MHDDCDWVPLTVRRDAPDLLTNHERSLLMVDSALRHKVAIVTGAASGIGRATAVRFAAAGATVVLADRDQAGAERAAAALAESGTRTLALTTDVTSREQVQHMADRTE